jgi:HlyD family secretion protein
MVENASAPWRTVLAVALASCTAPAEQPPGYQGIVEHEVHTVAAEAAGRVDEVSVRRGDAVLPGDVLALLDDTLGRLGVDVRQAEVEVARADLALLSAGSRREDVASVAAQLRAAKAGEANAAKSEARARELFAAGALPQAELDRAEAEAQRAKGERQSLEARLSGLARGARPEELARAEARATAAERATALETERVSRATLRSLVAGTVTDVLVEPGELAGVGTPVVTLADLDHPYAEVFVPQDDLGGVAIGRTATLHVDATDAVFRGQVEWISPRTEFTPRYVFSPRERPNLVVRVRVRIEDPEHALHAGVPAFVELAP